MTLDEFVAVVLIMALIPVAIIQWMGLIVAIMVQAVVNVQSKYGEEAAMKELMGMMTEAAQQYCEATKGDEKCEVLN